jgi:hypothetical protein
MSSPVQEHSKVETTPERIARLRGQIADTLPRIDRVAHIAGRLKGAMIASDTANIRSAILDGTATTRTALRELAWALEELSARSVVETRPADAEPSWELEDYRARLIAVSALLVEPVTPKNLRDARGLIAPLYQDALLATKARRASASSSVPNATEEVSRTKNGESNG